MVSRTKCAYLDMAIVASCDTVIYSLGTFGWWAAWLSNKTVFYQDEFD